MGTGLHIEIDVKNPSLIEVDGDKAAFIGFFRDDGSLCKDLGKDWVSVTDVAHPESFKPYQGGKA